MRAMTVVVLCMLLGGCGYGFGGKCDNSTPKWQRGVTCW